MKNTIVALTLGAASVTGITQPVPTTGETRIHITCPQNPSSTNNAKGCSTVINGRIFTLTSNTEMDGKCRNNTTIVSGTLQPERVLSSHLVVKDKQTGKELEGRYVYTSDKIAASCKELVRKAFEEHRNAGIK